MASSPSHRHPLPSSSHPVVIPSCRHPILLSSPPVVIPASSCRRCSGRQHSYHHRLCHRRLCRHPCCRRLCRRRLCCHRLCRHHSCRCCCCVILPLLSLFVAIVSASLSISPRLPSCKQSLTVVEMGAGVVVAVSPFCGSSGASQGCHSVAPAFHPASSHSQRWRWVLGSCCCVACFVPPPDIFNLKMWQNN